MKDKIIKIQSNNLQKIAFFSALCMFLSLIEFSFPKPLPFMRIGFANMGIMLSIFTLSLWQTMILVFIKVIFQSFISGTVFSYVFLFSFCGSFASLFFMQIVKKLFASRVSFLGIAMAGSLGNNLFQIFLSYLIVFKEGTRFIAPVLLINGFVSSLVLGVFIQIFVQNSLWYKKMLEDQSFLEKELIKNDFSGNQAIVKCNQFSWKKFFLQLLKDFILAVTIIIFSLLIPGGKVLFDFGKFQITQGALFLGIKRATVLILSVQISKLIIPSKIILKGKIGMFLNLIFIFFKRLSEVRSENTGECVNKKLKKTNLVLNLDKILLQACFFE
ncbi:MAG: Gx transporter family protein [Treponemataceae bacterium]